MILLQLPMRDLLFAQRTCQWFQSVTEHSPRLQRALFLKRIYLLTEEETRKAVRGPSPEYFGAPFTEPDSYRWCRFEWEDGRQRIYHNPLFGRLDIDPDNIRHRHFEPWSKMRLAKLNYPNASWQRMLVCQPAVPFVGMRWDSINDTRTFRRHDGVEIRTSHKKDVKEEGGVRLGTLREFCVRSWSTNEDIRQWSADWRFWWPWEGGKTLAELMKSVSSRRT